MATYHGASGNDRSYKDGDTLGPVLPIVDPKPLGDGSGNDILHGQGGNDFLDGGAGDDFLDGGGGDDIIRGGGGSDTIFGDSDNDTIEGRASDDDLDGGPGVDRAVFGGSLSDYSVSFSAIDGAFRITDNRTAPQVAADGGTSGDGSDRLINFEEFQFKDGVYGPGAVLPDDYGNSIGSIAPPPGTLTPGGTVTGLILIGGDIDVFAIDLEAGSDYLFEASEIYPDPGSYATMHVRLLNANGGLLAETSTESN